MEKNKIFENNSNDYIKWGSKKWKERERNRRAAASGAKSGPAGHDRYTAIMDLISQDERAEARELYSSDEVFELGSLMSTRRIDWTQAKEFRNDALDAENEALAKELGLE